MAGKKLNAKQMQAIELLAKGFEQKQVAEMVKCHESTICNWLKISDFRQLRDDKISEQYKDYSAIAQAVALEIMLDKSQRASDRLKAAFDIQDRAGYKPVEKIEQIGDTNITVSIDEAATD